MLEQRPKAFERRARQLAPFPAARTELALLAAIVVALNHARMSRSAHAPAKIANQEIVMGWIDEEHPEHEGYAIGYVPREGCASSDSGLYRELGYPADNADRSVARIAAGCDCGWRSPRWVPDPATDWSPHSVHTTEADDERVHRLWKRHLELDVHGADRGGRAAANHALAAPDSVAANETGESVAANETGETAEIDLLTMLVRLQAGQPPSSPQEAEARKRYEQRAARLRQHGNDLDELKHAVSQWKAAQDDLDELRRAVAELKAERAME